MALLKNLFKKKPGGSMVGNLIRGVASGYTGGILGSGANRIELGQTQTNAQLANQPQETPEQMFQRLYAGNAAAGSAALAANPPTVGQQIATALGEGATTALLSTQAGKAAVNGSVTAIAKKYWWLIAALVGFLGFLTFKAIKK